MPKIKGKTVKRTAIIFTTSIPKELAQRIKKFQIDKAFRNEQEVLRVGTAHFLAQQGY